MSWFDAVLMLFIYVTFDLAGQYGMSQPLNRACKTVVWFLILLAWLLGHGALR